MDIARHLHLLAAGDLTAWPDLARDLERRSDADTAAQVLSLLHGQGHLIEAAQWLARITDTAELQDLRAALLAQAEGWPVGKLRAVTHDLLSGDFRLIPAGSFLMGSPEDEEGRADDETQHLVEITQPFLLKTTPVTQGEWLAVMGGHLAVFNDEDLLCPVEPTTGEEAVRFCEVLSTQTGGVYRLPTEAQWEYACRAGTTTARYGDLDAVAWYRENITYREDTSDATHPVGQKQPNAWGLYDMLGHVWEWCFDWYDYNYLDWYDYDYHSQPVRDPKGPPSGSTRVLRGGAWYYDAQGCRAAKRNDMSPESNAKNIGFRPAGLFVLTPANRVA